MSVNFKVIQKGQPGVAGGGTKKYYATIHLNGEKTLSDLTSSIEKISTVSGADIRAVLYALVDVMKDSLKNGEIIRLGDLGSLRLSISSIGMENEEDVNDACIKRAKVLFTPGTELRTMLKILDYKKDA